MRKSSTQAVLALILLAGITIAAYWKVTSFGFVYFDDDVFVLNNPFVSEGLSLKTVGWAFTTPLGSIWHPVTSLSFLMDYEIGGLFASQYHTTNIILHILNTLLLFILLYKVTGYYGRSMFAAALFAVHPLHVESVAWIAERKDVLSCFFMILSLLAYHRYTCLPSVKRYIPVVILFILGLMSKPMLVTMPFLLILLDWWPLTRVDKMGWRRLVLEKVPLLVVAVVFSVIAFLAQRGDGAVGSLKDYSIFIRFDNAVVSYISYLYKMLWPRNLAIFYPHPGDNLSLWSIIGSLIALLLVTLAVIRYRRKHAYLLTGWLWYICALLPVIGLVQVGWQGMADRYTYIPLIGIYTLIAWGSADIAQSFLRANHARFASAILACGVILSLTLVTRTQVNYWSDGELLFRHTLKAAGESADAHFTLGTILLAKGSPDEAMSHFQRATVLDPDYSNAHGNLANMYAMQGRFDKATAEMSQVLRIDPNDIRAHMGMASILMGQGKREEAIRHYRKVLRIRPDYEDARIAIEQLDY